MKIGMIAGESSGDYLGAELIPALKTVFPHAQIIGILGPKMLAEGCCDLLEPMESIALMGLWEIAKELPRLFKLRQRIIRDLLAADIDLFIGIDAPEFNLSIEKKLRQHGIPTVHYVSPSVWAWRPKRIFKIKKCVDLMLTLFPFEAAIYQQHAIPVAYVGHPLAKAWAHEDEKTISRDEVCQRLGIPRGKTYMAILPGSRVNELKYLGPTFLKTAQWCQQQYPHLHFITPMVNEERATQWKSLVSQHAPELPLTTVLYHAKDLLQLADVVLVTSGTATLETMLAKKPMVVAFRMSAISYHIFKYLVHVAHIAWPNLLAQKRLVPEFIQSAATPEALGQAILDWLTQPQAVAQLQQKFTALHQQLNKGGEKAAADAIYQRFMEIKNNEKEATAQAYCRSG